MQASLLGRCWQAEEHRLAVHPIDGGGTLCRLRYRSQGRTCCAGIELARICLGGLGEVSIVPGELGEKAVPLVQVVTDHPVQACLAQPVCRLGAQGRKVLCDGLGADAGSGGQRGDF